jgi:hypothetical protein
MPASDSDHYITNTQKQKKKTLEEIRQIASPRDRMSEPDWTHEQRNKKNLASATNPSQTLIKEYTYKAWMKWNFRLVST